MKCNDLSVRISEFRNATEAEEKAWLQFMFDRGATQNGIAKLLGTSAFTVSRELAFLGMNRPRGARSPEVKQKWLDFLEDPDLDIHREPVEEPDEWDIYTGKGEDTSYPLTDADFEGFANEVVAEKKEENPVPLRLLGGSAKYYGTPAQIAETWFKSMPEGKVMVTITWE